MNNNGHGSAHGIPLKKQFGQHFLREQSFVDTMISKVSLTAEDSVFEIGCGDGFLTSSIQKQSFKRLWIFEIDASWAEFVRNTYPDDRMTVYTDNILDVDFSQFEPYKPWVLLSNLPYQVTFPILHMLKNNREKLLHGVIMVQEEVAQKIVKTEGRGYGFISLYFQHFFEWELLDKVPSVAFYPPPKVQSRLLYFKPRQELDQIPDEDDFWIFIKRCFMKPRRILKNNLQSFHYKIENLPEETLLLRGEQISKKEFIDIWTRIKPL